MSQRATGITAYLENGGTLEHAPQTCAPKASCRRSIAAHESPCTTKFYDRTTDQVSLDEIERIATRTAIGCLLVAGGE